MSLGIVLGQPIWRRQSARRGFSAVMLIAALVQIGALAIFAMCGATFPLIAGLMAFVFGLGNGGVGMAIWGTFSEVVSRLPRKRASLGYGLFTATAKLALAAGVALLGAVVGQGRLVSSTPCILCCQ